jgi:hypothetical protein
MTLQEIYDFSLRSGIHGFMYSAYGWPFVESIHFIALATLLGTVGLFDLRALGLARGIPLADLHRLVPFGVAAYGVNVCTGALFFVSAPDQYLYNPAFQLKLASMAIAGLNVAVFYAAFAKGLNAVPARGLPAWPVRLIAAISLASWLAVIVFGRLITMFRPPYHWCPWC